MPDLLSTRELAEVLHVLSAMITPAVLILASSSLLITTSNRSVRCNDRIRDRVKELEAMATAADQQIEAKREHNYKQLDINIKRARLLQRAMSRLYAGIGFFIATSISIGVVSMLNVNVGWIPLLLGFGGALLLFSASVYLIIESRLAMATTYAEMDYIHHNYMARRS
jgi:hypothetical protein